MGEKKGPYNIFIGKHIGNRSVGKRCCRWEDNIKLDLKEIIWGSVNWIHLVLDRDQCDRLSLTNLVLNFQVPIKWW
jgi:hypothetical protein